MFHEREGPMSFYPECLEQYYGLPWWLRHKESACNAGVTGDAGPIPGSGRSPGIRARQPTPDSHLENPMGRGAWQARVHRVTKSRKQLKWLGLHTCQNSIIATQWVWIEWIVGNLDNSACNMDTCGYGQNYCLFDSKQVTHTPSLLPATPTVDAAKL